MSEQNPPENAPQTAGRRTGIVVAVAVLVAAVLGGGAFAAYALLSGGGPQPVEALPATTVAVVSVDLDPSAKQKIAGLKTLRKFPELRKQLNDELKLQPGGDLREVIVRELKCEGLDFDADVKPWVGKRAAFAAVDLGRDTPTPAFALQITDSEKAKAGLRTIAACSKKTGDHLGYAVGSDYAIVAETSADAAKIQQAGAQHPLSDDASYRSWADRAGDRGVLNFYVAKKASTYLVDQLSSLEDQFTGALGGGLTGSDFSGGSAGESVPRLTGHGARAASCPDAGTDPFAGVKSQLKGFDGLAGTLRFNGGGMELSLVTSGLANLSSSTGIGSQIGSLPADTALALGLGIPKGYVTSMVDQARCTVGAATVDDFLTKAEESTGLNLPEDLTTLLGSAVTLSVGGKAPAKLSDVTGPADLPVGLTLHGDAPKINTLITKVEEKLGQSLSDLGIETRTAGSKMVLSPSKEYADDVARKGGLGEDGEFAEVVPDADRAGAILYLDFSSAWRSALVSLAEDMGTPHDQVDKVEQNLTPLKAVGLSSWLDGTVSHVLLKVSTN